MRPQTFKFWTPFKDSIEARMTQFCKDKYSVDLSLCNTQKEIAKIES